MIAWDGYLDTQTFYASHGQFMFIYYLLIYKHTTYLVFQKCVLLCTWISGDTVNWKLQKSINGPNKGKTIFGSWSLSCFQAKLDFEVGFYWFISFLGPYPYLQTLTSSLLLEIESVSPKYYLEKGMCHDNLSILMKRKKLNTRPPNPIRCSPQSC